MKKNYATQFLKAGHKGFTYFISKGFFELIPRIIVPEGETIFPAVWSMKKKKRLKTRDIYKYKS